MRIVKINIAVRNISIKRPWAMESADTTPEAAIAPQSWATKTIMARIQPIPPMSAKAKVTAGLKRPGQPGSQTESKRQADVQQNARVRHLCQASLGPSVGTGSGCIGDLRSSKGEEQEEKGADEFAEEGDEVRRLLRGRSGVVSRVFWPGSVTKRSDCFTYLVRWRVFVPGGTAGRLRVSHEVVQVLREIAPDCDEDLGDVLMVEENKQANAGVR
ncbi:hypothetical protein KC333_g212 [Hortaea werneckii]|nr:hypothetical protein KC333_g212 [Hortaea werneckii]